MPHFKICYSWKVCIAALLLAFLTVTPALAAARTKAEIDAQIKQQEQQYKKLQDQISSTKQKIIEKKKQEQIVTGQLEDLSQKITMTQQRVNIVNLHITRVRGNINDLSSQIVVTKRRIKDVQSYLKSRIVSIYKYGGITEFNLLFSAQGAEEAMSTTHLLSKIALQDQKMIRELQTQHDKLRDMQDNLRSQKVQLESQGKQLRTKTVELKSASDERNAILSRVRKDKAIYLAQQAELLRASEELQNKVKQLVAEKKRLNQVKHPGRKETVYYKGGALGWPLQGGGTINSTFGVRVHPVFKTRTKHTGVDIGAPKGTPVLAADAGEVLYTGWMRGYGQVIIIDHGGSLTTVYAHLSAIECTDDAKVAKGQQIGRVGSTGVATGNHLHFEVRVNGNAVDPMRYLR